VLAFDYLSNLWNLLPNEISKSYARRNKYLMQQQLRDDGIPHVPFFKSAKIDDLLSWARLQIFRDFVLKPILSFGTDGVNFCYNSADIRNAYKKLIKSKDYAGNINTEILIQQLIKGDEYVVDVVSSFGHHHIVNMFKYSKTEIDNAPIYRAMITVDINEHKELVNYVKMVLTSLGIKHGPSHNEVFMTSEGPILVESAARMHGGLGPRLVENCNSQSLINLAIESRLDPRKFQQTIKQQPKLKKYAVKYFMSAKKSGIVHDIFISDRCAKLESYLFDTCILKKGDLIQKTHDLVTSFARVVLVNDSLENLKKDLSKLYSMDDKDELLCIKDV
jgi:biotin carboxylase